MTGAVGRGFVVTGRVQGVGFRWWARKVAEELELGGAVWNRDDGAVEVHVVGTAREVDAFRVRLAEGPPMARVDDVREVGVREELARSGFRVLR